jgi:predicted O-methyltransferase YrrM
MTYTNEQLDAIFTHGKEFKIQQKKPEWMGLLNILNEESPKKILEIGANTGGSTITLSYFAEKLISIDVIDPPLFDPEKIDNCDYQYFAENSQTQTMYDTIKEEFGEIDFLMIDGDHSHKGSYNDYLLYRNLVKKNGIIAFHDIVDSPNHRMLKCFVSETWKIVRNNHTRYKEIIYTNENVPQTLTEAYHEPLSWGGIGVVYKD